MSEHAESHHTLHQDTKKDAGPAPPPKQRFKQALAQSQPPSSVPSAPCHPRHQPATVRPTTEWRTLPRSIRRQTAKSRTESTRRSSRGSCRPSSRVSGCSTNPGWEPSFRRPYRSSVLAREQRRNLKPRGCSGSAAVRRAPAERQETAQRTLLLPGSLFASVTGAALFSPNMLAPQRAVSRFSLLLLEVSTASGDSMLTLPAHMNIREGRGANRAG